MDGSVQQIAVDIEEAQKVLDPTSKDGRIERDVALSIRTVQWSMNLMRVSIHCL